MKVSLWGARVSFFMILGSIFDVLGRFLVILVCCVLASLGEGFLYPGPPDDDVCS